jgi:hypothetical protein
MNITNNEEVQNHEERIMKFLHTPNWIHVPLTHKTINNVILVRNFESSYSTCGLQNKITKMEDGGLGSGTWTLTHRGMMVGY